MSTIVDCASYHGDVIYSGEFDSDVACLTIVGCTSIMVIIYSGHYEFDSDVACPTIVDCTSSCFNSAFTERSSY